MLVGGASSSTTFADTWEWHSGWLSVAATFGSGCGSPPLQLSVLTRPTIGTPAQASLSNVPPVPGQPNGIAFVGIGFSNTAAGSFALPLPLAGFGMPGCFLLHSAEAASVPTVPSGPTTATFTLHLPINRGFIGVHLFLQGWAYAPTMNTGHTIVSNGIRWEIGNS